MQVFTQLTHKNMKMTNDSRPTVFLCNHVTKCNLSKISKNLSTAVCCDVSLMIANIWIANYR